MKVKAKKHLGQHFLNDKTIAKNIVDSLSWKGYSVALEIGPGMGVLTQFLLENTSGREVKVIEIDSESVVYLKNKYPELPILEEDFLRLDIQTKFKGELAVIGNFPYNISSQILFKVLENKLQVPELVGMFQKEVAERVVAKHGNKIYGILSVLVQTYYDTEYLFTVNEDVFSPPPKVKSAVIRLVRKEKEPDIDRKLLFRVVKAAFNHRRKTLRNSLKAISIPEKLNDHKFITLRAEQLTVDDFLELASYYKDE